MKTAPTSLETQEKKAAMNFRAWTAKQQELEKAIAEDAARCERRRKLGIFTPDTLRQAVKQEDARRHLVEGLLRIPSVNLLVGDSGLGKTPLAVQIGICVAGGIPVFGRRVRKGCVLYCDAESGQSEFLDMLEVISRFQGLSAPPADFHVWSPNWETDHSLNEGMFWKSNGEKLHERVKELQPSLVVVDALRTFWPTAESKSQDAAETIASLRRSKRVTWLVLHHRRKVNQLGFTPDLVANPHAWFQEAAGAHALVNQSDARLGVVPGSGEADLRLAGFIRGTGPLESLDLARVPDDCGDPVGYRQLTGAAQLNSQDQDVFKKMGARFRFKDVQAAMGGTSASNANRFVKRCVSLQLARREGTEYVKTPPAVEQVEQVE